ncbi:MAG: hypothetical protein U1D66_02380, partial [Erythrobacter sp.]|nr:hypothetical protein [Erythrobacter sp.]
MPEAALIDGKAFAESLRARIGVAATAFAQATGRRPGLAVVLVGEDPASKWTATKSTPTHAHFIPPFRPACH